VCGAAALLVAGASIAGLLPPDATLPLGGVRLDFPLVSMGLGAGISLVATACWMYFGARYGKVAERDKLLDQLEWKGDERVLDVGCGRGLILVGAARRLKTGSAVGVDIWNAKDLSGNTAEMPLRNAALEGVAERVSVQTADMRKLPFPDGHFDVVVSRAAIHNLYAPAERAAAIREIARVMAPGGQALIMDIRHHGEYAAAFSAHGCDPRRLDSPLASALVTLGTMGSLRPHTLLARKAAAPVV
jgi:SAM-dependent methyltransferase